MPNSELNNWAYGIWQTPVQLGSLPGSLWQVSSSTPATLEHPHHCLVTVIYISNLHSLQEKSQREAVSSTSYRRTAWRTHATTSTVTRKTGKNGMTNASLYRMLVWKGGEQFPLPYTDRETCSSDTTTLYSECFALFKLKKKIVSPWVHCSTWERPLMGGTTSKHGEHEKQ